MSESSGKGFDVINAEKAPRDLFTPGSGARPNRFRILVGIDGSDESYRGLRYAAKLGGGVDADIVLCYVRPIDQGLRSGGLQVRVARENMLEWGLELPGIKYLRQGLKLLQELGVMDDSWQEESFHQGVEGDPLGDNKTVYSSPTGKQVTLKLKVAPDIATGILEQWEIGEYDLIIIGASERWRKRRVKSFWDPALAEKIAVHAPCSVLVARELEVGHGHLICTDGSDKAEDAVRIDAELASRCNCPVTLLSVAHDDDGEPDAVAAVARASTMVESQGIEVHETLVRIGEPVKEICETGVDYSLIVLSDTARTGLKRFFMGSVAFKVLEEARNSVMIVR
ncbi:MAG: universal stress protein [Rhodobacterales bacterium]|nr:universal stress protein [Rhodobacterales bacterium]